MQKCNDITTNILLINNHSVTRQLLALNNFKINRPRRISLHVHTGNRVFYLTFSIVQDVPETHAAFIDVDEPQKVTDIQILSGLM